MKLTLTSTLKALALAASISSPLVAGQDFCTPTVVSTWEQSQIFTTFVHDFYIAKDLPKAFQNTAADYIQHNPFVGQGPEASLTGLGTFWPNVSVTLLHIGYDNGYGYVHTKCSGTSFFPVVTAVLDIYRFNGSCIAEHWDLIQGLPPNATNPLALF